MLIYGDTARPGAMALPASLKTLQLLGMSREGIIHQAAMTVKTYSEAMVLLPGAAGSYHVPGFWKLTGGIVRLNGEDVSQLFLRHSPPMRTSVARYHRHRFRAEIGYIFASP
jgi:hypothetical protein